MKKRVHFFYLGSQHLPEEEIMTLPSDKKWRIVYWFTYNLSGKDALRKVSPTFCEN